MREIVDVAFQLNTKFRQIATPAYFDLLGLRREYNALINGPPWLSEERNRRVARHVARMLWEAAGKA